MIFPFFGNVISAKGLLLTKATKPCYTRSMTKRGDNMAGKAISHVQGKGSLAHNNREFKFKNVDSNRTENNIVYKSQSIDEAYQKCFGEAQKRFNEKQTRSDRKIDNSYFEHMFGEAPESQRAKSVLTGSNKQKSFYEALVQVGDMDDSKVGTAAGELAEKILDEYMKGFSARNPNFYIFNAVLHLDEATPHLHIDYIPIGHYSRGMDTQNGLAKALEEMGYGKGKGAINEWRLSERKVLEDICKAHGIEVKEPKEGRGYSLTPDEYKAKIEAEKDKLKLGIKDLISESERLDDENRNKKSTISYLDREIEYKGDKLNELTEEESTLRDTYTAKKYELSDENFKLIMQNTKLSTENGELERQAESLQSKALAAKEENDLLSEQKNALLRDIDEAQANLNTLRSLAYISDDIKVSYSPYRGNEHPNIIGIADVSAGNHNFKAALARQGDRLEVNMPPEISNVALRERVTDKILAAHSEYLSPLTAEKVRDDRPRNTSKGHSL
jgi:hypothetical protein